MSVPRLTILSCLACFVFLLGGCLFGATTTTEPQVEDVQPGQRQITSPPGHDSQPHRSGMGERNI
ncbi:MAG: hypothetical protein Q4F27_06135 [Desulfovibrionaceae bacterium]|nr:hypothetical protein [Desulfovibrionaceae bacterium]